MLFAIHCLDHPDKLQTRLNNYDAHRAHLNSTNLPIVLAGPVAADDGETPVGSLMVMDAPSRAEVEAFNRNDPFYRLDVWDKSTISIQRLLKKRGWLEGY